MTTTAPAPSRRTSECACGGVPAPDRLEPEALDALPEAQLLALLDRVTAQRRAADVRLAAVAAAVRRRSTPDDAGAGLARRRGFATPARLVADATGGSGAEAQRLIAAGDAMHGEAPAEGPRFAVLAAAASAGDISVEAASAISAMLARVEGEVEADALERAEQVLVARARALPLDRLAAVIRQLEARLDAQAHERRERAHHEQRYLQIYEDRRGMVVIDGKLDVEAAAPLRAAIDGMVAEVLRRRRDAAAGAFDADGSPGGAAGADDRTPAQVRADALAELGRHALGCEARDLPLAPTTTVVVRVGLEELRSGLGFGEIDSADEPLSATAARRMAAGADVIPEVLDSDGEVLDLGRARRLFTRAQRLALAERDGGCSWCHAPPSWTEAHHVRWWDRDAGPTDLSNGVLLCAACHHRVHRDGWEISVGRPRAAAARPGGAAARADDDRARAGDPGARAGDAAARAGDAAARAEDAAARQASNVDDDTGPPGAVWFVPPASVDPERRPVLGGRARFGLTPAERAEFTRAA